VNEKDVNFEFQKSSSNPSAIGWCNSMLADKALLAAH
jgi:hypothetical protein